MELRDVKKMDLSDGPERTSFTLLTSLKSHGVVFQKLLSKFFLSSGYYIKGVPKRCRKVAEKVPNVTIFLSIFAHFSGV